LFYSDLPVLFHHGSDSGDDSWHSYSLNPIEVPQISSVFSSFGLLQDGKNDDFLENFIP
jgi:hypothetical protein